MLPGRALILPMLFFTGGALSPVSRYGQHAAQEWLDRAETESRGNFHASADPTIVASGEIAAAVSAKRRDGVRRHTMLRRSDDGLFYVRARIDGVWLRLVVDTGASDVVLTGADAASIGLVAGSDDAVVMRTVGGPVSSTWTTLDQVQVGERAIPDVRAAIVGKGLTTSLLGQNLLKRLGKVTLNGDTLQID